MTHDRDERIRQRAYEIWEREGRPEGMQHEHWQRAEREIDAEDKGAGSALSEAARSIKDYASRVVTAGLTAAADVVEEAVKTKRTRRKTEGTAAETADKAGTAPRARRKTTGPAPEQVQSDTPEGEIETATLAVAPEPSKGRTGRKTAAAEPTPEAAAPTRTRRKADTASPTMQEAKPMRTGSSAADGLPKNGRARTKESTRGDR